MLNRYPDQTRARKGLALVGIVFLTYGVVMTIFEAWIVAGICAFFGSVLLLPSILCGKESFQKFEKIVSRIALFGSLS